MDEFKARLKEFIISEVNPDLNLASLDDDEPLLDSEIIDSLGILKIMAFMDEEFEIDLSAEEIQRDNFTTVNSICSLAEKNRT